MDEKRCPLLIVDGHSMIFSDPVLALLQRRDRESARAALEGDLCTYQDTTGTRVVVVFDGVGARTSVVPDDRSGIQTIYSAAGETADTVIERLVRRYAGEFDITVATDDRAEQDTVVSSGASWMGTAGLRSALDASAAALSQNIRRLRS